MVGHDEATRTARVLLVTDDDSFSSAMKSGLPGIELLSITQDSVWLAIRAGLDVTRGISTLVVDSTVGGLQQLRLYERLRPPDIVSQVPIVFTRAAFANAGGTAHALDFYQPPDSTAADAISLVEHVLGLPRISPRVGARLPSPLFEAVARRRERTARRGAAIFPGVLQKLALWGVAAALIGFTFWPIVGSTLLRQVVQASFFGLSGSPVSTARRP